MLWLRGGVGFRPIYDMLGDDLGGDSHFFVEVLVRLTGFTKKLEQAIDNKCDFTGATNCRSSR